MGVDAAILALGAVELRDRLASGALRAVELMQACIRAIEAVEPRVQAFAWFDPEHAMRQAALADAYRATGKTLGALHGLPVAVKDVIDTKGIPTRNGTSLDEGRVPGQDASVVARLKAAGAIIIGKTVTAELAFLHPGKTRNPVNPGHTPGGSSSGSAAAVAAGMVPLAIGTQTGGSVIRPAAFCGCVGYLPSAGSIARSGTLSQSPSLDRVGVFARSVEDAAMLAAELFGDDGKDRLVAPMPHPRLLEAARSAVPVPPQFAFARTPYWEQATPPYREALEELAQLLGEQCFDVDLPGPFAQAKDIRERINYAEMAKCYNRYMREGASVLSSEIREALDKGKAISAADYIAALDWPDYLYAGLEEIFQRCDVILSPSATGAAPASLDKTGDSVFNALWTLCGTPVITLPVFEDGDGMPMGVQLAGRRGGDARLLRTARWLAAKAAGANTGQGDQS
jgi:Asp-tRNA(Asn)/Glu-tRNA(Gln) amidotransferase A subunit family amidase